MLTIITKSVSRAVHIFFKHIHILAALALINSVISLVLHQSSAVVKTQLPAWALAPVLLTIFFVFFGTLAAQRVVVRILINLSRSLPVSWELIKAEITLGKAFRFAVVNIIAGFPFLIASRFLVGKTVSDLLVGITLVAVVTFYLTVRLVYAAVAHVDTNAPIKSSLSTSWRVSGKHQGASIILALCYVIVVKTIQLQNPVNPTTIGQHAPFQTGVIMFVILMILELMFGMFQLLRISAYDEIRAEE